MGIYLTLSERGESKIPLREIALSRLHYAIEAVRFFYEGRIFVPYEIRVWKGRPSEALGGQQLGSEIKVSDFYKDIATLSQQLSDPRQFPLEQLLATVIQIN